MKIRKFAIALLLVVLLVAPVLLGYKYWSGAEALTGVDAFTSSFYFQNDRTIYSTSTLDDFFSDDRVVVVLNHRTSLNFRELTPTDFPEVQLASVECITPGLELA